MLIWTWSLTILQECHNFCGHSVFSIIQINVSLKCPELLSWSSLYWKHIIRCTHCTHCTHSLLSNSQSYQLLYPVLPCCCTNHHLGQFNAVLLPLQKNLKCGLAAKNHNLIITDFTPNIKVKWYTIFLKII